MTVEHQLIAQRYRLLDELGRGGMGVVYRAEDRLNDETVALKVVQLSDPATRDRDGSGGGEPSSTGIESADGAAIDTAARTAALTSQTTAAGLPPTPTPTPVPTPDSDPAVHDTARLRLALAREFRILSGLRHPGIISVLDYGFDQLRRAYFTMELLPDARTLQEATEGLPVERRVELTIEVLQALTYLHRRGVLHRDLKPGNVLVTGDRVKLLDFGIAELSGRSQQRRETVEGTVLYLAPEALRGEPPTVATDLYAVGVMLHELCTGRHPFAGGSSSRIVYRILHRPPDLSSPDLPDALRPVIQRLLAKDPGQRFADAGAVITALCEAARLPLPAETSAIRESFLQAAGLIGRDRELARLAGLLDEASSGRGGALLVAGESGVGKSRLLDELRTLGLVRGAAVLTGHAVEHGARPYEIWRNSLRWLALATRLEDLEAGVLAPLVPDLPRLVGRTPPPAPKLDPSSEQERLLRTVVDLFRRQEQTVVLILDDLHWASSESLALVARLVEAAAELPLLILVSFRDDETPRLAQALPGVPVLKIDRLDERRIAELSESMLGAAGRQEAVLELLHRETEGNVFFLIEVVRSLAEDVGQLDRIGSAELPESVAAGGIRRIVQRRLGRVPRDAHDLLAVAAVAGRNLDLPLLQASAPERDLDSWLRGCADVAVLEVRGKEWRFAHDKLREGVIEAIPGRRRRELHRRVAELIEQVHVDDPEQAASVAYHWSRGTEPGKSEVTRRALDALGRAADVALRTFSNETVVHLLRDADALAAGRPAAWQQDGTTAAPVAVPRFERATWELALGQACRALGRLRESREHLERSIALLGRRVPRTGFGLALSLLGAVAGQTRLRLLPRRQAEGAHAESLLERAQAYNLLSEIYWFADEPIRLVYASLCALNTAERAGPSPALPPAYAALAPIAGLLQIDHLASAYADRARAAAETLGDLPTTATTLARLGLWCVGAALWDELERTCSEAIDICREVGNESVLGDCLTELAFGAAYRGQWRRSLELWERLEELSHRIRHLRAVAHYGQATVRLRIGRTDEALDDLAAAREALPEQSDATQRMLVAGLTAAARRRAREIDTARAEAALAAELVRSSKALNFSALDGHVGIAEVTLAAWRRSRAAADRATADRACKGLETFARTFPIARPQAALWRGRFLALDERLPQARKAWRAALLQAEELAMPWEAALALGELGRTGEEELLEQARAALQELGARHDLSRIESWLEETR